MGVPSEEFPDIGDPMMAAVRKQAKRTMKSTTSPYAPFNSFYPLENIIDAYMEIWYRDDSDSSSSWPTTDLLTDATHNFQTNFCAEKEEIEIDLQKNTNNRAVKY